MGGNSAATGGGGSGVPDMIRPAKVRRKEKFKESLKNIKTPVMLVADAISKSVKKSKAKKQANVEIGLGTDRMSNYTIGQGGTRETGGEADRLQGMEASSIITKKTAGGQTVQVTAPTEAEVSQSAAADTDADDIYNRKKKSKARGRSMMTLTSAQGVTNDKLILGKKTLLGS
tara:strand:- start:43 stop:561 length:519 start_codon:yes stop_codon:yes gene_type:complete